MPKFKENPNPLKYGKKSSTFKMKGHSLPGINQRSDAKAKYEAKKEARKTVAEKIFMEDTDNEGLMKKGKKLGQAFSEIQQYTDY